MLEAAVVDSGRVNWRRAWESTPEYQRSGGFFDERVVVGKFDRRTCDTATSAFHGGVGARATRFLLMRLICPRCWICNIEALLGLNE